MSELTLDNVKDMLFNPNSEMPWHELLPKYQKDIVLWLVAELEKRPPAVDNERVMMKGTSADE